MLYPKCLYIFLLSTIEMKFLEEKRGGGRAISQFNYSKIRVSDMESSFQRVLPLYFSFTNRREKDGVELL